MSGAAQLGLDAVHAVEPRDDIAGVGRQTAVPIEQFGLVELVQPGARAREMLRRSTRSPGMARQPVRRTPGPLKRLVEKITAVSIIWRRARSIDAMIAKWGLVV